MPADDCIYETIMSIQDQEGSHRGPSHGGSGADFGTLSGGEIGSSNRSERRHPTPPTPRPHAEGSVEDDMARTSMVQALSRLTGLSVATLYENIAALARRYAVKKESFVQRLHTAYLERREQDLIEDVPSEGETHRAMREFMMNFLRFESDRKTEGLASVLPSPVHEHLLILAHAFLAIANFEQGWSRQEHDEFCQLFSL